MKAQDLKNSILQLAIQGKLVEQRAEEGTAKELLEKITVEKKQLILEGKIKKTKALPEITEEEIPFDIPDSWEWVRLEQVCEYIQRGKSPKYSDVKKYPVVAQKCNQWSGFSLDKAKFIDPKTLGSYTEDRILQDGDLMWNSTGLGTLGRVALYEEDKNPYELAVADSHVTVIRPLKKYVNFKYLYFYIANPSVQNAIEKQSSGSTKQIELATNTVKNYIFPLPPANEQKRIVAKIEELMPYVEKYDVAYSEVEKLNKKFPEDMQKSILQYAIQGKLVEQRKEDGTAEELYQQIQAEKKKLIEEGKIKKSKALPEVKEDEIPFDIPENWRWVRLGDIVSVKGGKRLPPGKKLTQEKTKHIYIRVTDMKNQTIDDKDLHYLSDEIHDKIRNYIIEKSDIYIVIVGSTIGKVGLVPEKFHGMNLTENAARLIPICVNKEYLMRYLTTQAAQTQFIDLTNQVGQPKLALIRLKNTLVPLAPIEEQKRIVEKIEEMLPYTKQLVK